MMSILEVQERLTRILRDGPLGGSGRALSLDDPLGEVGLGLDSLALVQFLVAVEREFGIRIALETWSRAEQISIRECAGMIVAARSDE